MFITNNHFVALVMKRKFGKVTKILKILCSWLQLNILRWKSRKQSIRLVKQQEFCGAITLTYLVKNCLDLPQRYLRTKIF